jgi:hypothetical protein
MGKAFGPIEPSRRKRRADVEYVQKLPLAAAFSLKEDAFREISYNRSIVVPMRTFLVRHKAAIAWSITLFVIASQYVALSLSPYKHEQVIDEKNHVPQIEAFVRGRAWLSPDMPEFPTFHLFSAALIKALPGTASPAEIVWATRAIVSGFSILALILIYLISRKLGRDSVSRMLAFATLPIAVPFFVLGYTDLPGISIMLLSVYLALEDRPAASFAATVLSVLVRQPLIVWAALPALYLYRRKGKTAMIPYACLLAAFVGYIAIHGSIAVGDASRNRLFLDLTNVWSFLMVFFLCNIVAVSRWAAVKLKDLAGGSSRRLMEVVLLVLSFCAIVSLTFVLPSPIFNGRWLIWYIHNKLFWLCADHAWAMTAGSIASFASVAYLAKRRFALAPSWIFLALCFIAAAAMPAVEERYYLPMIALSTACGSGEGDSSKARYVQIALNICLSAWVVYGTYTQRFFL